MIRAASCLSVALAKPFLIGSRSFLLLLVVLPLIHSHSSTCWAQELVIKFPTQEGTLGQFLEQAGLQSGHRFVAVAAADQKRVRLPWSEVSFNRFLTYLRRVLALRVLLSGKTYFVVPLLTPEELWRRLATSPPSFPSALQGQLTTSFLTPWGWRTESFSVAFHASDRLVVKGQHSILWGEGDFLKVFRDQPPLLEPSPSPLYDWLDPTFGVQGIPAFGYGWSRLKDWQPTESGAVLLYGQPVWVLQLTRKGSPPTEIVNTYSKVALPGTVLAYYKDLQPVPWRIRCYLDIDRLTVLRREVWDPKNVLLQVLSAVRKKDGAEEPILYESEVFDSVGTRIGKVRWETVRESADELTPPTIPAHTLRDDDPALGTLRIGQRAWAERDDRTAAIAAAERAAALSSHPWVCLQSARLLHQLGEWEKAWKILREGDPSVFDLPVALSLAASLALSLGREEELIPIVTDRFDQHPAHAGSALARLTASLAWKRGEFPSRSSEWYQRTILTASQKPDRTQEEEALMFQAAQSLAVLEWSRDALPTVKKWVLRADPIWEPIRRTLLIWCALDEGNGAEAREQWRSLSERCPDALAVRLFVAELAEAYGLEREADAEYRFLSEALPLSEEGKRAQWHRLRRLIEEGKGDDAVHYFLEALSSLRGEQTRSAFAGEFRNLATLSLRHNLIAQTADAFLRSRRYHPNSLWLTDLMAQFSVSEGQRKEALDILDVPLTEKNPFWAMRWSQEALAVGELSLLDKRLASWRQRFKAQPFFSLLFAQMPILRLSQESHPAVLRQLVRDAALRVQELKKTGTLSSLEEAIIEGLTLLNNPANWLDKPSEVKGRLERLVHWAGDDALLVRNIARQALVAFHGFHLELPRFLALVDSGLKACHDETSQIVLAQNALQVLVQRGQWDSLWSRIADWLSGPRSDLFRRSLLTAWRVVVTPFSANDKVREGFLKILDSLPDEIPFLVLKAEAYEALGASDTARRIYEDAARKKPPDWFWTVYGEALLRAKRYEGAESAFLKALERAPDLERAVFWIQAVLGQEKRPDPSLVRRLIAHLGWQWVLLTAMAPSERLERAFTILRIAERFATFDPTIDPRRLFGLRLQAAEAALRAGAIDYAQKWVTLFLQLEAPPEFQQQALELSRKIGP